MDLNKVSLIGTVQSVRGYKPKPLSKTDKAEIQLTLSTRYIWKDGGSGKKKQQMEIHEVIAYGTLADIISEYALEGKKVYIEGMLTHGFKKPYSPVIVADDMIMLGDRKGKS